MRSLPHLAYAFLERHGEAGWHALWIKPDAGFAHGHIVVAARGRVFDYHGYAEQGRYLAHTFTKARRWWPGWSATLVDLPVQALVSEERSRRYEGLWLREPGQFLHDALPRARAYLDRFAGPS